MNARKKALLEAALMCSRRNGRIARELASDIEKLADSKLHYYPPKKPVIDQDQVSENSLLELSGTY